MTRIVPCGTCSRFARPPPNIGEHRKASMLASQKRRSRHVCGTSAPPSMVTGRRSAIGDRRMTIVERDQSRQRHPHLPKVQE
jgi:hypothetical protein